MKTEKRKGLPENGGGICGKKTKQDKTAAEDPTDAEVEEFYVILRRTKQAAEYFGVKRGMLTRNLRAAVATAAIQNEKEDEVETAVAVKVDEAAPAVVKRIGLRLDLNVAAAVESDSR